MYASRLHSAFGLGSCPISRFSLYPWLTISPLNRQFQHVHARFCNFRSSLEQYRSCFPVQGYHSHQISNRYILYISDRNSCLRLRNSRHLWKWLISPAPSECHSTRGYEDGFYEELYWCPRLYPASDPYFRLHLYNMCLGTSPLYRPQFAKYAPMGRHARPQQSARTSASQHGELLQSAKSPRRRLQRGYYSPLQPLNPPYPLKPPVS